MAQIAFLIPFLVAIPMALLFGFSLSSPDSLFNVLILAVCVGLMFLPIMMRWHDLMLIAAWNMPVAVFFLPGRPQLWMLMVFISLLITAFSGGLTKNIDPTAAKRQFNVTKSVGWSLILLMAVVLLTAYARGGIGGRAMGSEIYGAKKYVFLLIAALGFFALSRIRIPERRRNQAILLFFGGYLFLSVSNIIYMAGPSFYWLYYIFPSDFAMAQAMSDQDMSGLTRLSGIAFSTNAVFFYLLARFGIRKIMEPRNWVLLLLFLVSVAFSTVGGFRSLIGLMFLVFVIQFYYEGLFRSHLFPMFLVMGVLAFSTSVLFLNKMPFAVQRALSFLPVQVETIARDNARASSEWRFQMWSLLWSEVPKYLVVGKGYRLDPAELDLFDWARKTHRAHFEDYEESMVVGDYHSGPFSVLLSFGIPGVIAVLFFWGAGIKMLKDNLTRGSPELRQINIALLSFFIGRIVFFLLVFGDMSGDLQVFCGLLGLSAALNYRNE